MLRIIYLLLLLSFFISVDAQQSSDQQRIGRKGGTLSVEDPKTSMTVMLNIPVDALREDTTITLSILTKPLPKLFAKTLHTGISISPEGLLFKEKVKLEVYSPPFDFKKNMILFRQTKNQLAIPCGETEVNEDENSILGNVYISGSFNIASPSAAEAIAQLNKLKQSKPAYALSDNPVSTEETLQYAFIQRPVDFSRAGLAFTGISDNTSEASSSTSAVSSDECMRWQKVMIKMEGILGWVETGILIGNERIENEARNEAKKTLQDAINDFLIRPEPQNPCTNYIKAAAKYMEAGTLVGIDVGPASPLYQRFEETVDKCSYRFAIEIVENFHTPRENSNGSVFESKLYKHGTVQCYIPFKDFMVSGRSNVQGSGDFSLNYEEHFEGDVKKDHETMTGTIKVVKVEGGVIHSLDEYGFSHFEASITMFLKKNITIRNWGVDGNNKPFDFSANDDSEYEETKTFPLKHGYVYEIKVNNGVTSLRVFNIKTPGDEKENPNDCF